MKKVVLIGNAAAGKSTLSMKLKEIMDIPVYHLDKILWKADWVRVPEDEFTEAHTKILNKSEWIIDGVAYKSTIEERFSTADTIIFLDTPLHICKERGKKRMEEDMTRPNPYVSEGCRYPIEFIKEQNDVIEMFHNEYRQFVLDLVDKFKAEKNVYHLKDNEDAERFLEKIKTENTT